MVPVISRGAVDPMAAPILTSVGQRFEVRLEATPTAGYRWEPLLSSEQGDVVEYLGSSVEQTSDRIGGSAIQRLAFRALTPGDVTLVLVYRRPWEDDVQDRRTILIRVE